jgi:hypothetical protein
MHDEGFLIHDDDTHRVVAMKRGRDGVTKSTLFGAMIGRGSPVALF